MIYDVFFSICQTEVDGYKPTEREMFNNFFDQVKLADRLGYKTAWIAETHLSCEVQKENPGAVIPHFKGEIGLNTDILQLAHKVFAVTDTINVGSAIMNILCNGGPIAHAEAIKTFLALHGLEEKEKRVLEIGFAAGRFPFSNVPYGIRPRDPVEEKAWPVVKGLLFREATEIFLRALKDESFSSNDITKYMLTRDLFRTDEEWNELVKVYNQTTSGDQIGVDGCIPLRSFWDFDKLGVIPFESRMELLKLTIGSHDPLTQKHANKFLPCGVFNLSITPSEKIDETHVFMQDHYHKDGGSWQRHLMPRTCLIFVNGDADKSPSQQTVAAKKAAKSALENYWLAMEGTLDPDKIEKAVNNSIAGNPEVVAGMIKEKYHPQDRLMLWFDFNNHNNEEIKNSMETFANKVIPLLEQ
ncbi:MAG: LLM class flavin-dependent oxidoreductase [Bdellovibrionota bacterium]